MSVRPLGIGTSISRIAEATGRRAQSVADDVVAIFKSVDSSLVPTNNIDVFRNIPTTGFKKVGDDILTASSKRLGDWSSQFRSGLDDIFETSMRDIDLPANGNYSELKLLNRSKFPDADIIVNDIKHLDDQAAIGSEVNRVDRMTSEELDAASLKDPNDNSISNLWNKVKTAGSVVLVTGAVVGAGLYFSSLVNDAIALNSGCFLVVKEGDKTVWKRILGYSCGNKTGDDLWLKQGLPTVKHPLDSYFEKPLCSTQDSCNGYCISDNFVSPARDHLDLIPDNSTLVCHTASISEILGDVATGVGSDIGNITGGVVNGVTGGLADAFGIDWSWIVIILAIVFAIICISLLVKTFKH